jgi:UPF0716 protein FxsA
MLLVLALLFIVVPIVELAVIVQVAQVIGIGNTILLLIAMSVIGSWLCKREGLAALRRVQASLQRHELPARDIVDGGLILFAGALLITPGFVSDALGVLLLLPPTRAVFRSVLLGVLARRAKIVTVGGAAARRFIDTTGTDDR